MKRTLLVLLVALIAVTSVFAGFDKSNLNISVRPVGLFGQIDVSYDFNKWTFGAGVELPAVSILLGITNGTLEEQFHDYTIPVIFADYKVVDLEKFDLSVGAMATYSKLGGDYRIIYGCFDSLCSYHFTENHSITAKVAVPLVYVNKGIYFLPSKADIGYVGILTLYNSSIGYTYSF